MTFLSCWKNGLIRKIRSISKFMISQAGEQTITIHISPNISRSKDNQTMKFGQLIEYIKKIFFFKNHAESKPGRLVPDLILLFKEA